MSSPFSIVVNGPTRSGVYDFEIFQSGELRLWDLSLSDLLKLEFEIQRVKVAIHTCEAATATTSGSTETQKNTQHASEPLRQTSQALFSKSIRRLSGEP